MGAFAVRIEDSDSKAEEFPPRRTRSARPHNLPAQRMPFIGRAEELAEIAERLADPACRLLTLVGPGGIGKTRLALQVAAEKIEDFPDGVFFVPLASLSSADFLVSAIADAIKFSFYSRGDPKAQLLNYLRAKEMLLVMDNFEHLVDEADLLTEILTTAPDVKVLVTSRERLNLQEEWILEVPGMDFPASESVAQVEDYSAVRLFVQSARRLHPDFSLSEVEKSCLVRICQLVDGIPLGIELATAWIRALSCQEIAEEIGQNRDFLATSLRNVPERHRSLRAAFEYSWDLLAEEEKNTLKKLSVFRGGFQREAASQVAGAALSLLRALVDKSLLHRTPSGRYEMLEVIRQYAEDKFDDPQEKEAAQDRHCSYYTEFLRQREGDLKGGEQQRALEEIREEIENVRAAWRWAVERVREHELGQALESLYRFYEIQSWFQEGAEVFGQAVAGLGGLDRVEKEPPDESDLVLGRVLAHQGGLYQRLSRYAEAEELLQKSLALFRRLDARAEMAFPFDRLGLVAYDQGDYAAARRLYQKSLDIYREAGDRFGTVTSLNNLGLVAYAEGTYPEAKQFYQASLDICRETGNRFGIARTLHLLGLVAYDLGEYTEAKRLQQESLEICREINDQFGIARSLNGLGLVAYAEGAYPEAEQLYRESLELYQEIGDPWTMALPLNNLGDVAYVLGEYSEAERLYRDSLAIRREIGDQWGIARSLNRLGRVAGALGDHAEAKQHLQESLTILEDVGDRSGVASSLYDLGGVAYALSEYQASRTYFREALKFAVKIRAVPLALHVLIGMITLLMRRGEEQALALLTISQLLANESLVAILYHPASDKEAEDKARRLLPRLKVQLPPQMIATTWARQRIGKFAARWPEEIPEERGEELDLSEAELDLSREDTRGTTMASIVLIGSDRIGLARMRDTLTEAGHRVETGVDLADARILVRAGSADVLIVDVNENVLGELSLLEDLTQLEPDLEVVLILGPMPPPEEQQLVQATQAMGVQTHLPRRLMDGSFLASLITILLDRRRLRRENKRLKSELEEICEELDRRKARDALTGLPDYSYLQERLMQELDMGPDVCLMIVGIDNFEEIRQTQGHRTGERLLQELAEVLQEDLRGTDILTRTMAIEQFAAILPQTRAVHAKIVARRIQEKLASRSVEVAGTRLDLSVSAGIAEASEGMDVDTLINLADRAWQRARRTEEKLVVQAAA